MTPESLVRNMRAAEELLTEAMLDASYLSCNVGNSADREMFSILFCGLKLMRNSIQHDLVYEKDILSAR